MEVPQTEKTEKFLYGTIKNNGESSYVKFDGSDFLTPVTSAMGYEDGDRVMVMMKDHRAIVTSNMTSPGVSQKYVKENCASFDTVSAINARIDILEAGVVKTSELDAAIANIGYLKSDYADLKYASISSLNASNAEIENLKSTTIKTTELSAEVAKLGYASVKELEATTAKIDNLTSKAITTDNLTAETAKLGYLTANQADIRYLTASTADTKFLHADMSDMDIAKIQTLFATAGIVSDMTIKDGHITGELSGIKVSANDISAGRLDAATIDVVNLNAANITVGTINGQQIASGAIDLSKLGSDVTNKLADTEEDVAKAVADAKKAITDSATAQSTANSATSTANAANSLASTAKNTADSANSSAVNAINIANGISVGGRNLISNIASNWQQGHWDNIDGNYMNYDGRICTKVGLKVSPGETYALKIYLNGVTDKHLLFRTYGSDGSFIGSVTGITNCIYTVPSNVYELRFALYENVTLDDLTNGAVRVKVEKGNKATDWTPAPEDIDSSINTASIKNWCYDGNLAWMNGAKIYASTIVSDAIAADAITAVKIKAGAITADKLAANSVTAGKIAANAVTAGTIAAGSITTDKISANAVSADKIAANAVTADKILAKSITAAKIATGTITSDEIASGTIKATNINVTDLVGNSAFINSLKSNTVIVGLQNDINGISVGGRNRIRNSADLGEFKGEPSISSNATWNNQILTRNNGNNTINYGIYYVPNIVAKSGETWTLSMDIEDISGSLNFGFTSVGCYGYNLDENATKQGVQTNGRVSLTYTFNQDVNFQIYISMIHAGSSAKFSNIKLEKGNKSTDWTMAIEDWCYNNDITYINGGKIYTGTVTADKLAANSVTAGKILAGAITADKLAANSVTAAKIDAGAITADKLAANSVTADKIATHTITADKLAVGSITANELSVIGGLNVTDAKLYNDFFVLEKKSNGIDFIVKDADSAELFTIKTEHPATSSMWNEFMVNNFNQISFTGDDIYLNGSVYVNDVNLSNVYTGGGGLFNTSTALLINGNALNSKWAQLIIEYNGSCFGIRNDGGNTYLMNGNTNGWTNYCSFNTNGNWGFPGNATLPGTLTAGALFSTGGLCLAGRTNAQTTAKPNAYIDSAGNVWKSSTTSSKRFKEDVKPVENMELNPENLYDIDVVQFKYKKGHFTNKEDPRYRKDMIGFIAEDVYEHYPMAADYHIGDDGNVVCDGWNEQYLIPAMLKLIQDQHKRILELEKGIQNG